jgi:hypothetical protein
VKLRDCFLVYDEEWQIQPKRWRARQLDAFLCTCAYGADGSIDEVNENTRKRGCLTVSFAVKLYFQFEQILKVRPAAVGDKFEGHSGMNRQCHIQPKT